MKRSVVTGAADGIGRALALRLTAAGYALTGVDVDGERAARVRAELERAGGSADFVIGDLARAADVERIGAELVERGPFDVVVHNAGINCVGRFADSDLDRQRQVLDVNFLAPALLTRRLLHAGAVERGATLVFVSSLSRFVGYPGAAGYAASKDAVGTYGRSLAVELAPRGLRVLTVYPGPTRTEQARRYAPRGANEAARMDPDELAARVLRAVERGRRSLVTGLENRCFALLGRWLPGVGDAVMKRVILDRLEAG